MVSNISRFFLLILALCFIGCTNDDAGNFEQPDEPIIDDGENPTAEVPDFTPVGTVELINPEKVDQNYILVNDAGANRVYVINKEARLLHEWAFSNKIGNDVFLLPNANLLASLESDDPKITLGGKGGRLQFIAPDNTIEWDFIYSSLQGETHHDAELLPNGNVLAMVWERKPAAESVEAGFMIDIDVFPESIIEIDPNTNEIVWEWHSWDHLVQDYDETKNNYGSITEQPERIDFNYIPRNGSWPAAQGDLMHANAIAYDEVNDLIYLSVNYYSEVWVIDHSTTTQEAAGRTGGNYNKGGDLVYRFGNPSTYQNTAGNRLFYNNHFPNLLKGADQGKLLIFSNGTLMEQSTVYELVLPETLTLEHGVNNEPRVSWFFTDPDLYSQKVSGAVPLPNGNLLITEGDFGFWEVTREKEVVWKLAAEGFFWRGYHFNKDAPEILAIGL